MLRNLLLVTALALVPLALRGAPVPHAAAPHTLSAADIVGTFSYSWGSWDGRITFYDDGTYFHVAAIHGRSVGTWRVEGWRLHLRDWSLDPETGEPAGWPLQYTVTFDPSDGAVLCGKDNGGGAAVVLSERR